jgi:hypothetical protein
MLSQAKYITNASFSLYFIDAAIRCDALLRLKHFLKRKPVAVRTNDELFESRA